MVVHTPDIVLGFLPDILQEFLINRVKRITELELTPKQDPALIGKVEQKIRTIRPRSLQETQRSAKCLKSVKFYHLHPPKPSAYSGSHPPHYQTAYSSSPR